MGWRSVYCFAFLALAGAGGAAGEPVEPGASWAVRSPEEAGMIAGGLRAFAEHVRGRGCVARGGSMFFTWGDVCW